MTDRLAEKGALAYAAENTATASTSPNRLGGAGYLHAAYAEYQTWAAANPNTNPSRLSAKGRLFGYFYDNTSDPDAVIEALFAAGEQGVWYDPSDVVSYTSLGSELVTNGDFSNGTTGWSAYNGNTSISVVSGALRVTINSGTATACTTDAITTVVGKTYEFSINMLGTTGTGYKFYIGNSFGGGGPYAQNAITGTGSFKVHFVATSTTTYVNLEVTGVVGNYGDFDNISLKEVIVTNPTMFQDSAGTTPVTAVEQPVGLVLDKSKGLVLGSELVTNGTFDSGVSGWLANGAATITHNTQRLEYSGTSANSDIVYTTIPLVVGKQYKVSWSAMAGTGTPRLAIGNAVANGSMVPVQDGVGDRSVIFVATNSTGYIQLYTAYSLTQKTAIFDNISVRELPGNHASQSTTTKRPILRARHNLLTYSEQFDNAAWTKSGVSLSAGTQSESKVVTCTSANGSIYQLPSVPNGLVAHSIEIRRVSGVGQIELKLPGNGVNVISVTSEWKRFTSSQSISGGISYFVVSLATVNDAIEIRFPCAETGGSFTRYQRIAAATDYDTVGFPHYFDFDGTDDSLATAAINFSATDKMSVFAGVRKNNDTGAVVAELSADITSNAGSFVLASGNLIGGYYGSAARGTTALSGAQVSSSTAFVAPDTAVLRSINSIAGDSTVTARNGVAFTAATGDKGAGNFGNYPLYIGQRGGASSPLNGRICSLIVLGRTATAAEITATEAWVANKTGVTL